MLWTLRGTLRGTDEDVAIVVEADTRAEAECMGERRGLPVVSATEATADEVRIARWEKRLFRYSQDGRYVLFGHPVSALQLACLMACGIATMLLVLVRQAAIDPSKWI